jgi:hypothetical protein
VLIVLASLREKWCFVDSLAPAQICLDYWIIQSGHTVRYLPESALLTSEYYFLLKKKSV